MIDGSRNSYGSLFLRRARRQPSAVIGSFLILAYLIVAVFAQFIAPYSPIEQHAKDRLQPPNATYKLGTDEFGRDILSRTMYGATSSLRVAIISVMISAFIGTLMGTIAAYAGGTIDQALTPLNDLLFAFPAILLALTIAAALGPGTGNTIIAISIVYLPIFSRVARASVLTIKQQDFIEASRSLGASHARVIVRHILPNSLSPTIVQVSLALSWAILTEASLSFLGLGTVPPDPSWGSMLSESRVMMELAPWMAIVPGIAIILSILGFNLMGDGLRDALDPRLTGKRV